MCVFLYRRVALFWRLLSRSNVENEAFYYIISLLILQTFVSEFSFAADPNRHISPAFGGDRKKNWWLHRRAFALDVRLGL